MNGWIYVFLPLSLSLPPSLPFSLCFEAGSHYTAQAGLELANWCNLALISLSSQLPPDCWAYKSEPPSQGFILEFSL